MGKMTASNEMEPTIETYTGKMFGLFDHNDIESVCIEDIEHALSLLCRYNGHTKHFYSVAEHSVLCSYLVPEEFAFDALMHDASETYLSDIPRPFKSSIGNYREIEDRMQERIAKRFGFRHPEPKVVKDIDTGILWMEAQALVFSKGEWWSPFVKEAYEEFIDPSRLPNGGLEFWSPNEAKEAFHARFLELTGD